MPYTDEFRKILDRFRRMYGDKAKAETLAFREAFELRIPTFRKRQLRFTTTRRRKK